MSVVPGDAPASDVTVVLATYDGERFLEEQVRSIFDQTLLPARIVASDDGSTDGTVALLHRLAAESPCPFDVLETGGRQNIRLNFLEPAVAATTRFISFSDQDDVWRPRKLEVSVRELIRRDAVLLLHSAGVIDANGIASDEQEPSFPVTQRLLRHRTDPWRAVQGFTMTFRRSILDHVDIAMPMRIMFGEEQMFHDGVVALAASALGSTVYLRDELASYRLHGSNKVHGNLEIGASGPTDPAERQLDLADAVEGWRAWALDAAGRAAAAGDLEAERGFRAEAIRYERLADAHRRRADLRRASSPASRAGQMGRMIVAGSYAPRRSAGLGPRSLVRDLTLLLDR